MKWKGCSITRERERESGPSDSIQVCLMFLCTFETLRGKWTYLFPFSFLLLISFASLSLFCTLSTLPFDVCFIFTPLLFITIGILNSYPDFTVKGFHIHSTNLYTHSTSQWLPLLYDSSCSFSRAIYSY